MAGAAVLAAPPGIGQAKRGLLAARMAAAPEAAARLEIFFAVVTIIIFDV